MKNILIVDDDPDIHELFKLELNSSSFRLFFAHDSHSAIEFLKSEYIAMIFLDIILGENETSQVVMNYSKNTPVFLMSSHITDDYHNTILSKNTSIIDCMKKPFDKGDILKRVESLDCSSLDELDDSNTKVSNTTDNLTEEAVRVTGSPEQQNDYSTSISGVTDNLEDDTLLVKGQKEEQDLHKEVIKGKEIEDEDYSQLLKENKCTLSEQEKQYKDDIEYLTNRGKGSRTSEGYTRLMIAVFLAKKIQVELALDDGENIEDKCKGGFTALHLAVLKNNLELTGYLLDKGAKITAKDNENREALFFAIQKGYTEMVQLLLERGAPTNRRIKGRTYLVLAAIKKNEDIFRLMKLEGIPLEIRDDLGFNVKYYLKKNKIEHFLS